MSTYFIVIILVFFSCLLATKTFQKNYALTSNESVNYTKTTATNFFLFITVAVLTFVAAFRYSVGTDYNSYSFGFINYVNSFSSFKDIFNITDEPGFALLCRIASIIYNDSISMFVIAAILTIVPFLYSTYKETASFTYITLLYIFCGRWHGCFNGIRQYLAATIIYLGRHYITERKIFKYLFVCFLAFLFHRSAIFCVLLYFVYNEKFSIKRLLIIVAGSIVLALNYDAIFSFVGWLDNKEFIQNDYSTASVNILRVLVQCCPAILAVYSVLKKGTKQEINNKQVFYVYMLIANAAIFIAMSDSAYLTRLGVYTAAFVPLGLEYITRDISKKYYNVLRYLIVIFYLMFWLYEISNSSSLNNFQWYFNK
ncbi:MAG: EpsG family protein [Ruminococcaceae bacterium]|nr:EpsG family protein [Oscillospiraceae bacterium]